MDERHNRIMAYVLDYPEAAAREIAGLRDALGRGHILAWIAAAFFAGVLIGAFLF